MSIKNKIITAGIVASSLAGGAHAQTASSDNAPQNKTTYTINQEAAFIAFNNIYSNALYIKYRTDAGIDFKAPTPNELAQKITQDAQNYAQKMADLVKNKAKKEELKALHNVQMSGVTASKDGKSFSYPYEKNGKPRVMQAELFGEAISFLEQEKEEREFKDFFKSRQEMFKNSR